MMSCGTEQIAALVDVPLANGIVIVRALCCGQARRKCISMEPESPKQASTSSGEAMKRSYL